MTERPLSDPKRPNPRSHGKIANLGLVCALFFKERAPTFRPDTANEPLVSVNENFEWYLCSWLRSAVVHGGSFRW